MDLEDVMLSEVIKMMMITTSLLTFTEFSPCVGHHGNTFQGSFHFILTLTM